MNICTQIAGFPAIAGKLASLASVNDEFHTFVTVLIFQKGGLFNRSPLFGKKLNVEACNQSLTV